MKLSQLSSGLLLILSIAGATLLSPLQAQQPRSPYFSAGGYDAAQFGAWHAQVSTPVLSPGNVTVRVDLPAFHLPDGPAYQPLAPGVPVEVSDGTASELITLSAVSCIAFTCNLTATFAHAHPGGFGIASGDGGLQEAINYVKSRGGGKVILSPQWKGESSQIATTQGSSNVDVVDNQAGEEVLFTWNGNSYIAALSLSSNGGTATSTLNGINFASLAMPPAQALLSAYAAAEAVAAPPDFGDGYAASGWTPSTAYAVGAVVMDPSANFQECVTAGTSSSGGPSWNETVGGTTTDGTVVWQRVAGSAFGSVLLDFRTGSQSQPLTAPAPYPFAHIFIPLWDDSPQATTNPSTQPYQPLASPNPVAFETRINESGSAAPTAFYGDVILNDINAADAAKAPAGGGLIVNCRQAAGDVHHGCWGINEGAEIVNPSYASMGNEVNFFNGSGVNGGFATDGKYGSGPFFGFAATDSGANGSTAAFVSQLDAPNNTPGWDIGFWNSAGVRAGGTDFQCGWPTLGYTASDPSAPELNQEGACLIAAPTHAASAANPNYPSLPIYLEDAQWTGSNSGQNAAALELVPSGTNTNLFELVMSQPGISNNVAFSCDGNGNCSTLGTLVADSDSQQPAQQSAMGLSYNFLGNHEADVWSLNGGSSSPQVAGCWYDSTSTAHCTPLAYSGVDLNSSGQVVATHLEAPLPITQGGTGATTATGSGAVVLAAAPNITDPTIGGGSTLHQILLTSATLSFTSIGAQSCQEQTVILSGAGTGGVASASPAAALGSVNLTWAARVSATGVVSVRVCNPTTSAITLGSVSWNVEVVQ